MSNTEARRAAQDPPAHTNELMGADGRQGIERRSFLMRSPVLTTVDAFHKVGPGPSSSVVSVVLC